MTQPAPPESDTGQVIAVAALGLALIAVEQQVRQQVQDTIDALYKGLAAAGLLAAAAAPASVLTGLALVSLPAWFSTTATLYKSARLKVRDSITSGYQAAAQVAYTKTRAELGTANTTDQLPALGDNLDRLLADIDTMFGHAQTDLQNTIVSKYDPKNKAALADLIQNNDGQLNMRSQASASTGVHAGANDALTTLYTQYQTITGIPGLMKRWRTTSNDPCGMCEALNGTMVGVNAEFDYNATTAEKDYRRVWRNLTGPPRHPNCRCQLELVRT